MMVLETVFSQESLFYLIYFNLIEIHAKHRKSEPEAIFEFLTVFTSETEMNLPVLHFCKRTPLPCMSSAAMMC